jgi:hypothetical protein
MGCATHHARLPHHIFSKPILAYDTSRRTELLLRPMLLGKVTPCRKLNLDSGVEQCGGQFRH